MLCSRAAVVWHIYSHMYKHPGMYVYLLRRIQRHLSKSPARPPAGRQGTSDPLWDMKTLPHVSPHSWTVVIRTCCPDSQVQQTEGESPWGENTVGAVTVAVLLAVQLAGWLYGWLADWFSCSRCSSQRIKVQQMQSFSVWAKDDKCLGKQAPAHTHNAQPCVRLCIYYKSVVYLIGHAWTINTSEWAEDTNNNGGRTGKEVVWLLIKEQARAGKRHQKGWNQLSRAHLSITVVKTSYLVPQSILSSLHWVWRRLKNPDARRE